MIETNKIYFEDCAKVLERIPDGSVDLLLQDTPFGVTQNEWDVKPDLRLLWPEWERVTKENAAMIFFATQPFASELIYSNLRLFRYDIIWYKALGSGFLNANRMPMRNHEHILVFYRSLPTYNPQKGFGKRKSGMRKHDRNGTNYGKFATEGTSNYFDDAGKRYPQSVIDFTNGDRTKEAFHPTQKPIDLLRYLIKTYSNEGELIFDGYTGSGSTAVACLMEDRKFIGCENHKHYWDYSQLWINEYTSQLKLPLSA